MIIYDITYPLNKCTVLYYTYNIHRAFDSNTGNAYGDPAHILLDDKDGIRWKLTFDRVYYFDEVG